MVERNYFIILWLNISLLVGLCPWTVTFTSFLVPPLSQIWKLEGTRVKEMPALLPYVGKGSGKSLFLWWTDLCMEMLWVNFILVTFPISNQRHNGLFPDSSPEFLDAKPHRDVEYLPMNCIHPGVSHLHTSPHSTSNSLSKLPFVFLQFMALGGYLFQVSRSWLRFWILSPDFKVVVCPVTSVFL